MDCCYYKNPMVNIRAERHFSRSFNIVYALENTKHV